MPPVPGSRSASSRTAAAEGRKKITIASIHSSRLAGPNYAAVVSQRSPTIAVMLKSTTSRSPMTRGSRDWDGSSLTLGRRRMDGGHQPPDTDAEDRSGGDVAGKVLGRCDAQRADRDGARVQEQGIARTVREVLAPRNDEIRGGRRERERRVPGRQRLLIVAIGGRGDCIARVQHGTLAAHQHLEPFRRGRGPAR